MSKFEDGSYGSLTGIALIGKVLAGRCQMHYTKAAAGNGTIPEGLTPKTMTGPAGYVMDAQIAAVSNPVDGECQVTVRIKSESVESGFYLTNIVLFAEDPDDGEVPYTYLCLENEPEWIRPASSVVGKLATFDLIAAVGDVDTVTAVIDPEAIATIGEVEQSILAHNNDPAAHGGLSSIEERALTIPKTGWDIGASEAPEGVYYVDIPLDSVTEALIPIVNVQPKQLATAKKCGLYPVCRTLSGGIRLYAEKAPESEITATVVLMKEPEN